jgi:hypothetical protein
MMHPKIHSFMPSSPNLRRGNVPLAMRLKIDDLQAQLVPLNDFGVPGLSSAIADYVRAFVHTLWH